MGGDVKTTSMALERGGRSNMLHVYNLKVEGGALPMIVHVLCFWTFIYKEKF